MPKILINLLFLSMLAVLSLACQSPNSQAGVAVESTAADSTQLGEYVVSVYEDSQNQLWFGTLQYGIARYDGNSLRYITQQDGVLSNRVSSVAEDSLGNLWFATDAGISIYDGAHFTNLSTQDGLCNDLVSILFFDSKGMLWIGTWGGICRYDGKTFSTFSLPTPTVETPINPDTKDWITAISEDAEGNLWFARGGYGAIKYDGTHFTHILKTDGLLSNSITDIAVGADQSIWLGSRVVERDHADPDKRVGKGGLNRYSSAGMETFPGIAGFNQGDVYEIYVEPRGTTWICTTKHGVYEYDGRDFTNHAVPISIMSMHRDHQGYLWLAGAGGLYNMSPTGLISNVTRSGPWP